MSDPIKIRLKFQPSNDLPLGEWMWARPVERGEGAGVFELRNSSFFVPLVAGDVVRAAHDSEGDFQITDLVRAGPHIMTLVHLDPQRCDAESVTARWAAEGALWTEGGDGWMVTIWEQPVEQIGAILRPDILAGYACWEDTWTPDERGRSALRGVDFELQ